MRRDVNTFIRFFATKRWNLIDILAVIMAIRISDLATSIAVIVIGVIISISFEAMMNNPLNEELD